MAIQGTNWIWQAYLTLAARGDLTEKKGRELLKKTFPNAAYLVDDVVSARGDESKIKPEKLSLHYEELAAEDMQLDSGVINAAIRQQASGQPIAKPEDVNAAIRGNREQQISDLFGSVSGKPVQASSPEHPINKALRNRAGLGG